MPRELSVCIDESGDIGSGSEYYLVSLVFHDQSEPIGDLVEKLRLTCMNLPIADQPFHFTPIMRGHGSFSAVEPTTRKTIFNTFAYFANKAPFAYTTFIYNKKEIGGPDRLRARIERDIERFVLDRLAYFQTFDVVKVYYDNGQKVVKDALHAALGATIYQDAIEYRDAAPETYRLFQVADYVCGIELTEMRFSNHREGPTEQTFFGGHDAFKKNFLKKLRKHRLD